MQAQNNTGTEVRDSGEIVITRRDGETVTAFVDAADVALVRGHAAKWHTSKSSKWPTVYVSAGNPALGLHRLIMDAPAGMVVDHIDGDGLNNRRSNLRIATNAENVRAARQKRITKTSQYTGVNFDGRLGKWRAQIKRDYQTIYLGVFVSELEAAQAYDSAAKRLFGEFSRLNFPTEPQM